MIKMPSFQRLVDFGLHFMMTIKTLTWKKIDKDFSLPPLKDTNTLSSFDSFFLSWVVQLWRAHVHVLVYRDSLL